MKLWYNIREVITVKKFLTTLLSILIIISYVGALLMHLYTSWLCNLAFGTFWAVIAFLTPPISDLIMCGVVIQQNGVFNPFTIEWVVAILLYTVPMLVLEYGGAEQPTPKVTFCKKCGSQLDSDRKCTGCGKQYFNNFKSFRKGIKSRINILSVSCIAIICVMGVVISAANTQLTIERDNLASLNSELEKVSNKNLELSSEIAHLRQLTERQSNHIKNLTYLVEHP